MAVYLPENVFAVCTNQLSAQQKKFELSTDRKSKTVFLGSKSTVFLVKMDKNLSSDFTCKSGWSSGAGTVVFGGGVVAGMMLVAGGAAMVPVAGWIVGGAIAVLAIGYGIWQMSQSPTCSQMIGFQESQWKLHHNTVRFDSTNLGGGNMPLALTKNSILACKEGGVLLPFISSIAAANAARTIANNNRIEMGVNIGSGVLAGVLFGFSMGTTLPAGGFLGGARSLHVLKNTAIFGAWIPVGFYIINPAANSTGGWLNSNDNYDKVKDESNDARSLPQPNTSWNPLDPVADVKDVRQLMVKNNASAADIAKFEAGIAEAKKQGTYSLKNNSQLQEMVTRSQNGEFGPEMQQKVTNKSGNLRGMVNEKSMNSIKNTQNQNSSNTIKENLKAGRIKSATGVGGVITLIAPFIGSYFAERAIRMAADLAEADNISSVTVNASEA